MNCLSYVVVRRRPWCWRRLWTVLVICLIIETSYFAHTYIFDYFTCVENHLWEHPFISNLQTPEIPALSMASPVYQYWQARLHWLSRDKFPPVPPVLLQIPVAARKAVTQWFPPLQDSLPTVLKEFHQWASLQPRSDQYCSSLTNDYCRHENCSMHSNTVALLWCLDDTHFPSMEALNLFLVTIFHICKPYRNRQGNTVSVSKRSWKLSLSQFCWICIKIEKYKLFFNLVL